MLLRPDREMNRIIIYHLALAAKRTGLQLHALCAMSTHIHLVVTDVKGRLPRFLQRFHRMVALCTRVLRRWNDVVWDKSPTSVVRLETKAAVVEKIAYVLANPVAAGLVRYAHEWPGAKVLVEQLGAGTLSALRPEVFVNPENPRWPGEAAIPITLPPGIDPEDAVTFRKQVATEVASLEAEAQAAMQERGRRFLGAKRAHAVSPMARATTAEPRFAHNPEIAVGRDQGDAWHGAVAALQAFRSSYRSALDQWRAKARTVVFPAGTWLMRKLHRARVAPLAAAT
jgi:REP element-mobilizing transposase RayT